MLDTIIPCLQGVSKNVWPTLPLLSQEGKRLEVGVLGLNLDLLVGGQVKNFLYPLKWSCHLGNHLGLSGSGWMPKVNCTDRLNKGQGPVKAFD